MKVGIGRLVVVMVSIKKKRKAAFLKIEWQTLCSRIDSDS